MGPYICDKQYCSPLEDKRINEIISLRFISWKPYVSSSLYPFRYYSHCNTLDMSRLTSVVKVGFQGRVLGDYSVLETIPWRVTTSRPYKSEAVRLGLLGDYSEYSANYSEYSVKYLVGTLEYSTTTRITRPTTRPTRQVLGIMLILT
ncbi:hypothetical protein HanRHA438_Chr15g0730041 [Helianthus annuus]|nr:hypothetical protein HanRHA438_Chr15g0730041 [Helianthus annuus]